MESKQVSGRKDDDGKDPFDLLPPRAIRALVRVLGHGARRYGAWNWKEVPNGRQRYLAALLRHVFAYLDGEVFDQDSGLPHMGHALANAAFILELEDGK